MKSTKTVLIIEMQRTPTDGHQAATFGQVNVQSNAKKRKENFKNTTDKTDQWFSRKSGVWLGTRLDWFARLSSQMWPAVAIDKLTTATHRLAPFGQVLHLTPSTKYTYHRRWWPSCPSALLGYIAIITTTTSVHFLSSLSLTRPPTPSFLCLNAAHLFSLRSQLCIPLHWLDAHTLYGVLGGHFRLLTNFLTQFPDKRPKDGIGARRWKCVFIQIPHADVWPLLSKISLQTTASKQHCIILFLTAVHLVSVL